MRPPASRLGGACNVHVEWFHDIYHRANAISLYALSPQAWVVHVSPGWQLPLSVPCAVVVLGVLHEICWGQMLVCNVYITFGTSSLFMARSA